MVLYRDMIKSFSDYVQQRDVVDESGLGKKLKYRLGQVFGPTDLSYRIDSFRTIKRLRNEPVKYDYWSMEDINRKMPSEDWEETYRRQLKMWQDAGNQEEAAKWKDALDNLLKPHPASSPHKPSGWASNAWSAVRR